MTRNRDRRIWAIARGEAVDPAVPIDDSETPPFVDAKTNLDEDRRRSSAPTASLTQMTVGQGLKVELFASEEQFPELVNPVQMAFDTRGRLVGGRLEELSALAAEDADGRQAADPRGHQRRRPADKRTVFAGDLAQSDRFRVLERRRHRRAAAQPRVPQGHQRRRPLRREARSSCTDSTPPTRTTRSTASRSTRAARSTCRKASSTARRSKRRGRPTLRQADGGVYRFEPRTWKFEIYVPMNFPNPHGHVFDGWGRDIIFDAHRRAAVSTDRRSRRRSTTRRWKRRRRRGRATCARGPSAAPRFSRAVTFPSRCRAT